MVAEEIGFGQGLNSQSYTYTNVDFFFKLNLLPPSLLRSQGDIYQWSLWMIFQTLLIKITIKIITYF